MIESFLIGVGFVAVCAYGRVAYTMRKPGDSLLAAALRPLRGGGPGEERKE